MDRGEGLKILSSRGWLSGTPKNFQHALLDDCRWHHANAGNKVQLGYETDGELIGLADGIIQLTTTVSIPEVPVTHYVHPGFWIGYFPILFQKPRGMAADAKTPVWLASVPQAKVRRLLAKNPEWLVHLLPLAHLYGDIAIVIAADLLIRNSKRRCAAVLLRLAGCRFADLEPAVPVEVPITQDELAASANLARNTTGIVLRELEASGLVARGFRGVTILSPTALRRFVEMG